MTYLVHYTTRGGAERVAIIDDAGDNGYSCPDAPGAGTHTYQARELRDVMQCATLHSSRPTFSRRSSAVAYLRRVGYDAADIKTIDRRRKAKALAKLETE